MVMKRAAMKRIRPDVFPVQILPMIFLLGTGFRTADANERKFTYVYESSVLPADAREIEVWNTVRGGKDYFFRALDQRIEFEFGAGGGLMGSFYLNAQSTYAGSPDSAANGIGPSTSFSVSTEWKYKLSDRTADPVGFAVYGELTLGPSATELEGKLIFDRQLGPLLAAGNIVLDREWETTITGGNAVTGAETELELDAGLSWALYDNLSFGAEAFVRNVYEDAGLAHASLYGGPNISYTSENWWITWTWIPQVRSFKGATNGRLDLDEFERMQSRLLFSFHL